MVLADSMELLYYPTIMFSSPLAPSSVPLMSLSAPNAMQTATTFHHFLLFISPIYFLFLLNGYLLLYLFFLVIFLFISDVILVQTFIFLYFMLSLSFVTLIYQLSWIYLAVVILLDKLYLQYKMGFFRSCASKPY